MSPEEVEARPLTAASDVFFLGSVLVMASTGAGPFDGPSAPGTLFNVTHAVPNLGRVPGRLPSIVERCLAKIPAERPTPAEILEFVGSIRPSSRPWPPAVHGLIERRNAELAELLDGPKHIAETPSLAPVCPR